MAVMRIHHSTNYTVVDNHLLQDKNLHNASIGLAVKILSLPPEWEYSEVGLVAISGDGRTAIRSQLKELEDNGYLVRTIKRGEDGRFIDCEYDFYESPVQNPLFENGMSENSMSENRMLETTHNKVNNDKVNNDKVNNDKVNTKCSANAQPPSEPSVKEVKSVKKPKYSKDEVYTYVDNLNCQDNVKEAVKDWLSLSKNKPTITQLSKKLDKLFKESKSNQDVMAEAINEAYINGWTGWYIHGSAKSYNNHQNKIPDTPANSTRYEEGFVPEPVLNKKY